MLFLNFIKQLQEQGSGLWCASNQNQTWNPPYDLRGSVLGKSQMRKPSRLPMRRPQVERKKLGVCQLEKTALFNKIFHRCYYLSTIQLRNCNCFTSAWTKVRRRAWRKFLGQGMQGSHLFMELKAREGAIKGDPAWTHFPLHLALLFREEETMCISGFIRT